MANLGYIFLVIALVAAVYTAINYFLKGKDLHFRFLAGAGISLWAVTSLVTISTAILLIAIFTHNFSFEYVTSYSSLHTSNLYLLSALWAGNSGSLLFWTWLLSIFTLLAVWRKQAKYPGLVPYAAGTLLLIQAFFLLLLVAVNNPFNTVSVIPADGLGLNPLLQNFGMAIHPPALYAGYVGFSIPFAFAVAALLKRQLNNGWLEATRRWMLFAWLLLGVGNLIGAWWAYVELGWGGYWAWDPVENVGLMPWLLATAFLHSSVMQRRKDNFKFWNMVLVVLIFNMVVFGTFLTRSSILSSVHTFNQTGMEPYFLTFIAIALIGPLALVYYRSADLKSDSGSQVIISRDSTFILNNLLLVGSTALIFFGTLFPLFSTMFGGSQISLSTSFFNRIGSPLFMIIILLAGICTLIGWRDLSLKKLLKALLWPALAALVIAIVLGVTLVHQPLALFTIFICAFVFISIILTWINDTRKTGKEPRAAASVWWNITRSNTQRYGGYIVHLGIVLIAIGIIGSSFFNTSKEANLKVGDSMTIGQYKLTYQGLETKDTPDQTITRANLNVTVAGKPYLDLAAEKLYQKSQQQAVTEVALHSTLVQDLYVILENWQSNGASADFKVLVNPLVMWIWIGGGVFVLGGLVAFWPSRKEKVKVSGASAARSAPAAAAPAPLNSAAQSEKEADDEIEIEILRLRRQAVKYCPQCGQANRKIARYCNRCRARLPGDKKDE
jgi:cytochrome c-type biogenesis protein CcmF